jgi:hypothetical protein
MPMTPKERRNHQGKRDEGGHEPLAWKAPAIEKKCHGKADGRCQDGARRRHTQSVDEAFHINGILKEQYNEPERRVPIRIEESPPQALCQRPEQKAEQESPCDDRDRDGEGVTLSHA